MGSKTCLQEASRAVLVNRFLTSILLIILHKYLKSCSKDLIPQNLILRTRSCDTAYITQLGWLIHFQLTQMCLIHLLYQRGYHFQEASRRGQPLNIFTWFIGSGVVLPGTRESPKCERGYFLLRGFFFFFWKNKVPKISYHHSWPSLIFGFLGKPPHCHTASAPSTAGTHTGGGSNKVGWSRLAQRHSRNGLWTYSS